jgi:hypothetical protein
VRASCPPGYLLGDDGCVKIPGGSGGGGGTTCGGTNQQCCNGGRDGNADCFDPQDNWCFGDGYCHNVHETANQCEQDYWLAQSSGGGTPVTCFASPICIGAFAAFQADNCDGCWWSYQGSSHDVFLYWMGGGNCDIANGVSMY